MFMSRGVVQISAFVDAFLASFLGQGAVVALNYAQSLYTLPVSLFGMSVSAAELPAMSRAVGAAAVVAETLRHRLDQGLRRISFFIVPSAVAFLALGDVMQRAVSNGSSRITFSLRLAHLAVSWWDCCLDLGRLTHRRTTPCRILARLAVCGLRVYGVFLGYFFSIHRPAFSDSTQNWGRLVSLLQRGSPVWSNLSCCAAASPRIGKPGIVLYSSYLGPALARRGRRWD